MAVSAVNALACVPRRGSDRIGSGRVRGGTGQNPWERRRRHWPGSSRGRCERARRLHAGRDTRALPEGCGDGVRGGPGPERRSAGEERNGVHGRATHDGRAAHYARPARSHRRAHGEHPENRRHVTRIAHGIRLTSGCCGHGELLTQEARASLAGIVRGERPYAEPARNVRAAASSTEPKRAMRCLPRARWAGCGRRRAEMPWARERCRSPPTIRDQGDWVPTMPLPVSVSARATPTPLNATSARISAKVNFYGEASIEVSPDFGGRAKPRSRWRRPKSDGRDSGRRLRQPDHVRLPPSWGRERGGRLTCAYITFSSSPPRC